MSIETWKAEFYDIPAEAYALQDDDALGLSPVEHSLKKWRGLTPENLAKHGVKHKIGDSVLLDDEGTTFVVDSDSCALCQLYLDTRCNGCPLFLARGYVSCDDEMDNEFLNPYYKFVDEGNPEKMIMWLERAL